MNMKDTQKTVASSVFLSGVGLHTGAKVKLSIHPSDANTGIKFCRVDLPNKPIIPADVRLVSEVKRSTTLSLNGATVTTIEHLLAALTAKGIDNCIIELDGPEVPILDGSALPFLLAFNQVGIKDLNVAKDYLVIKEPITYIDEANGVELSVVPYDGFCISSTIDFNSKVLGKQVAELDNLANFETEIASCRTFCFLHELEQLLSLNLIKGGDVDNAIVVVENKVNIETLNKLSKLFNKPDLEVKSEGILNNIELKFPNEPARHKLLDIVGDLTLVGKSIKGKIIAKRPGHKANVELGKLIKAYQIKMENQKNFDVTKTVLDVEGIKKLLPHRPPFLFVDRIIELTPERVVGVKNVSVNEDLFRGHFPDQPIFPGVLQVEAMAQVGGVLVLSNLEEPEKHLTYFMKMENVKFRKMVVPGDTLVFELTFASPYRRGIAHMLGKTYVNNELVAEAEMMAKIEKVK